jgi:hypothetical protein
MTKVANLIKKNGKIPPMPLPIIHHLLTAFFTGFTSIINTAQLLAVPLGYQLKTKITK